MACVGSWGNCVGGTRTYSWTVNPLNGGAPCPFPNGQTDASNCTGVAENGGCNPVALAATTMGEAAVVALGLCSTGTPSTTNIKTGTGDTFNWICLGANGGTNQACSIPCGGWEAGHPTVCCSGCISGRNKLQSNGLCRTRCYNR